MKKYIHPEMKIEVINDDIVMASEATKSDAPAEGGDQGSDTPDPITNPVL